MAGVWIFVIPDTCSNAARRSGIQECFCRRQSKSLEEFISTRKSRVIPAYVYILTSGRNGTLYLGVTTDLSRRLYEHQNGLLDGFSKRYGVKRLVYVGEHTRVDDAICREKQLKGWRQAWKIALIEESNPEWRDLGEGGLF